MMPVECGLNLKASGIASQSRKKDEDDYAKLSKIRVNTKHSLQRAGLYNTCPDIQTAKRKQQRQEEESCAEDHTVDNTVVF